MSTDSVRLICKHSARSTMGRTTHAATASLVFPTGTAYPMSRMFFIQYEVRPLPEHESYAEIGGAFANCFVLAVSAGQAEELALRHLAEIHWEVVSVEDPALPTSRSDSSDAEWLEWYDEAARHGDCYVFHQWPNEPQEDDAVH
ncbi:hypothetical protein [Caldimonas brevitalea]|uniref:hypothetical protein n=1 Tax=Caldimonas brevitalea TaxID=413882 RepID=UPI0012F721AA|nr:hypothetical protein [Caldimonas brevitalea]